MILYPAIDLKDGRCVRLQRGDMATATVFNDDPAAQATAFAGAGAAWLHVVDLDGAFAGRPVNGPAVRTILAAFPGPVQVGGGIRDFATAEAWLEKGVRRVILGSAAVRTPELVREACRAFPGRVAVGLDARDGLIATDGWAKSTTVDAVTLARRLQDDGVACFIYTDIARDGVLSGPNIEATMALAANVTVPVIASGGVASLADLVALKTAGEGVLDGVICGRALYDGRVDLRTALALFGTPVNESARADA